ncbi:NAD(P)/FAD-dependent oxidoreductase [Lentibacter sp. XHP0401]|jgi:D-arginine dehydrogenase|uniref:NAD(P)/FAD-dependent oxidoreductase n=1 Tax=Lentibacter sp. XHP0401 TaxID=2984334 RepID=UPI0021E6DEDB|nr:FAD-binding oxidoreductase [Lentibacter sp. XHP0401]MCV2893687.1 FAD-binding oxidoreductase [Lentibacter sp. XHP0401]
MRDIIVIGGGIAGISVAARLAPHAKVTVLEAESALAYHASGRSAALFEANYGLPSTVVLNKAGETYFHEANGGYLSPRGLMIVGRAAEHDRFLADTATLGLEQIGLDDALNMVPILDREQVTHASYHSAAWDIDTDRMVQDFARELRAHGGEVRVKAPVTAISRTEAGWAVQTPDGPYESKLIVNAAGAWVDEVATLAGVSTIGFTPLRRSMARIPAPGGHDVSDWPMFFGVGESWYAKPDAGSLIVSPAEEHPMPPMDAWADDMVLAEGLARYEELVSEPVTRIEANWAGLRTFSPDRALTIGFHTEAPDFFWHAGQGGYGFQTAPAASLLAADLILGRASELDDSARAALSPQRFAS